MDVLSVCRCCLAEGLHKDLKLPYVFLNKREIYSDMLLECFNIVEPTKINLTWTPHTDKYKLRDNFINILRFSNVLPFKNKSLLGFICAYCDIAFPDPADLRSHTDQDHKKDRLKIKFKKALSEYSM
ncbi:Uncharacterized protein OBRU01_25276, partial [Operophtera brumata]